MSAKAGVSTMRGYVQLAGSNTCCSGGSRILYPAGVSFCQKSEDRNQHTEKRRQNGNRLKPDFAYCKIIFVQRHMVSVFAHLLSVFYHLSPVFCVLSSDICFLTPHNASRRPDMRSIFRATALRIIERFPQM